MPTSNYMTQYQEEQARKEFLAPSTFDTVNTSSSGDKNALQKATSFVNQFAAGLNAANFYREGGTPYQQNQYYQPQTNTTAMNAGQNSALPWIIGGVALISFVAWQAKDE